MSDEPKIPKVFISYAWGTDEHNEWVYNLAVKLRNERVDVVLDHWDFIEGHDKYVFMEQMVTDKSVDKVLAICDKTYAEKADGRNGGVGTESQIISKDIYDQVKQEKFIPLIRERDEDGIECVPVFFRNRKYIDFSDDEKFGESLERLVRLLHGKPERVKPPLGKYPSHLLADSAPAVRPAAKLDRLKHAVEKDKPHKHVIVQDYIDEFLAGMEDFRPKIEKNQQDYDEPIIKSIESFAPYRDSFLNFVVLTADYMDDEDTRDRITDFMEKIGGFQNRLHEVTRYSPTDTDNYRFIAYELLLYLITTYIKRRKFETAAHFIEHPYQIPETHGGSRAREEGIAGFNDILRSLEHRKQRLKLDRASLLADMIVQRATDPRITASDLIQTDLLMCFRYFFPDGKRTGWWNPQLRYYLGRVETLPLFAKATTPAGLRALQPLLRVKSLPDLVEKLLSMLNDDSFNRSFSDFRFRRADFPELLSLRSLMRAAGIPER